MKKTAPQLGVEQRKRKQKKKITITEQNREIIKRAYFSLTNFQPL